MADHEYWMHFALEEAALAAQKGEVPVGSIAVLNDQVIARGHNLRESDQNPVAHAEILVMQEAARKMGSWRLTDVSLYVTLEPCVMCAGALVNSRISKVVWGSSDPKAGALQTLYSVGQDARLNHRFESIGGVLSDECGGILTNFFRQIRQKSK